MGSTHVLTGILIAVGVSIVCKLLHPVWQLTGGLLIISGIMVAVVNDYKKDNKQTEEIKNE